MRDYGYSQRILRTFCWLSLLVCAANSFSVVHAQGKGSSSALQPGTWQVRVKENGGYFLTVRAKEASLPMIAAELSRQLNAPVILSPTMARQKVSIDFQDMPLEAALQALAPMPYVHYELRGGTTPLCREVFLNAFNEPVPVSKLESKNISFIIQGNTEGETADDPLHIIYKNYRVSISVKKQPVTSVLDRLASEMGVNFAMKQDSPETIDLNFKDLSLAEAISYFPATVHLHVRKDLQQGVSVPLLVEFVPKTN